MIRMEHPAHGRTNVENIGEQKRLEGYGWRVVENKPKEPLEFASVSVAPNVVVTEKRKPGRPKK